MTRFKEILLTRIAPVLNTYWMNSCPCTPMGKLGLPKLAVAIGNFKENYKTALYSDAPELLEQAWQSVEQYHQQFLDFSAATSDTAWTPAQQKIAEFQEVMMQRRLATAGIDQSKTLAEVALEAGIGERN